MLEIVDLGVCNYGTTWELQKRFHERRIAGEIPDTLILVEHPDVYTLGKNADATHLIASQDYLKSKSIEIFHVDRGGDITYHGPGQLVGYPIFNLKEHRESISWYVNAVEEVLIQTLNDFGISSNRINGLTGIWINDKKIAAIGMRVSRWVTMHGFALNISTDLSLFSGIIPCGISIKGVTRIIDINPTVTIEQVKTKVVDHFKDIFAFTNVRRYNQLVKLQENENQA